jgi:glyoxylase-like metal-dependent hydrolase (beta-lactamase superfamily II)
MTPAPSKFRSFDTGITAIDTDYIRPLLDASHLIVSEGHAAYVDTGTNHSVPNLLAALRRAGLESESVEYIFLTHVHLDHAGGAGRLAAALPRAKVIVHERGAPHVIDPRRLISATIAVYGEAQYRTLYGELVPIAAERVIVAEDGAQFQFGKRRLQSLYTPGHALHHHCYVDYETREIFTGDIFGISYREFDTVRGAFIFVTSTPTQFDPKQMTASIDRIASLELDAAYLTHYSRVTDLPRLAEDLRRDVEAYVALAKQYADAPQRTLSLRAALREYFERRLDAHGYRGSAESRATWLDTDVQLNVQGLEAWLARSG